ncbi:MAG TPA: hypothetical protein VHB51_01030 [Candidatus Saccharimonadales bacterium]|nr:hypothetical protein [Candidatus Saccharimonadales bacterium]
MAAAAETIERVRPAEAETYGRSLSAAYHLGVLACKKAAPNVVNSPEANQAKAEFFTSVEEGFGTDMELGGGLEVRDFDARPVVDGKVTSMNKKRSIADMTSAGLVCAVKTSSKDKRFLPQLTRSHWDHQNALEVDKMARGETDYNTRIVISPFPEEAARASGDAYWRGIGYVPHLKRGFVQMYFAGNESVLAGSLSFDGSNKHRLREIFAEHGVDIPENEITDNWLKYAITGTLTVEQAKALALHIADEAGNPAYKKNTNTVDVTHEYREAMNDVFDKSYIHACESLARGCQTVETRQLVAHFAAKSATYGKRYDKALKEMQANPDRFTDEHMVVLHELLVYSAIEMMRALHLSKTQPGNKNNGIQVNMAQLQQLSALDFQRALSVFAAEGASNNRAYSACGLVIALGEGDPSGMDGTNRQGAYGGVDQLEREKLSWHGGKIKKGTCVNCKKETKVGVKNWCKKCIKC